MDKETTEARNLAKKDFYFFSRGVLGLDYMRTSPHQRLCTFMEDDKNRTPVIILPRGFLKTTLCSIAWPLWMAINDPTWTSLIVSNTDDNARAIVHAIRSLVENSANLHALFPEVKPGRSRWKDTCAELAGRVTLREGTFEAAGIGTTVTGRHYRAIIVDDPVRGRVDEATGQEFVCSPEDIIRAIVWISQMRPLFRDPLDRYEVHVGTRWAVNDVFKWLIKAKHRQPFVLAAIERGLATYERFPLDELANIKADFGANMFATQFMNQPRDEGEIPFPVESWRYWENEIPANCSIIAVVDPATGKKNSDGTAFIVVAVHRDTGNWYVLEALSSRLKPAATVDMMIHMQKKWGVKEWGVESVAYQIALKEWVEREARDKDVYIRVKELKTSTRISKELRILGLQPRFLRNLRSADEIRSGIFLHKSHKRLLKELEDFPQGDTDDLVDALAYCRQLTPGRYQSISQRVAILQENRKDVNYILSKMRGKDPHLPSDRMMTYL